MDQVEEIKSRNDIVEVISTYLTVKKAGSNMKANCPFHNEKTPSLMISPERQTFKCFGCGEGGDIITFIEKMEGLDFYNALKLLAERAGITLESHSVKFGQKEFKADKKTRAFEMNEWAKKVYHKILLDHPKAEPARKYLEKRGLSKQTILDFEIGYAPNSWDFILRFLVSKKYSEAEIIEAGLAIRGERGKAYDRFRGRIIFPINNPMGATIAFTSRILEDDGNPPAGGAKYINSAESPIYIKGKTIYGLDKAKTAIKEAKLAVLVEGNMDVIACHQARFHNVVATSGTALTIEQLNTLVRYAPEIALCFDSDNAGQTAMKRAVKMALQNDITTKIISTLPYKDADEAIKSDPKNWQKAVENARPSLEYWIDGLMPKASILEVNDKKAIAKEILPVIKTIASEIEKEHYIKYLAEKIDISEQSLIDALGKAKVENEFRHNNQKESAPAAENISVQSRLAGLIWANPELVAKMPDSFSFKESKISVLNPMIESKMIERQKVKPEDQTYLDSLAMIALSQIDPEKADSVIEEFDYLLLRIRSDEREKLRAQYAKKIQMAEKSGDRELLKKLLLEFSNLIK